MNFVKAFIRPDIEIVKIEITQAIQCLENNTCPDNSIPLYAGKPTFVRVYVRLASGPYTSLSNIGGRICLGDKGETGCGLLSIPSSSVNSLNRVTVRKNASVAEDRNDLNATINFLLPPDWVKNYGLNLGVTQNGKPLQFTVYVNYMQKDYVFETQYANNHQVNTFNIWPSSPMSILFVPVTSNGTTASVSEIWPIVDWLKLTYPTSNINVSIWKGSFNWNTDWGGDCGGWMGLMFNLLSTRWFDSRIWYGMVDVGAMTDNTKASGCGMNPISVSGGFVGYGDRNGAEIAAQEVGHNLRLSHAPGCEAGSPDPNYPKPDGLIDEYGLDVLRQQLYLPDSSYDLKGYCGGENDTWISRYTYTGLIPHLPAGYGALPAPIKVAAAADPNPGQRLLVGMGTISPQGLNMVNKFFLSESTSQPYMMDNGQYSAELQDKAGNILASQSFQPAENSNDDHEHDAGGVFWLALPWNENARSVVFKYQGNVIGAVKASLNAPTVAITSAGPSAWPDSGPVTITWSASDLDGDPLTSLVEYSSDGGTSWTTIAANLAETSLTIDTSFFPGSDQARLRVLVSDGFNTGSVLSHTFRVGKKIPLAHVSWPQDGTQLEAGTPLLLEALAFDPEDGMLDPQSLQWSSDRDGNLGKGDLLVDTLSAGTHTLTVTGTDSNGNAAQAQVRLNILPTGPQPESEAVLTPQAVLLAYMLGLAAAILLIGGLYRILFHHKRG